MAIQPQPGAQGQPPEQPPGPAQVARLFEQPAEAVSFFSDYAQIVGTGQEVTLQFYETIPGAPGPSGEIQMVRTRLRATIVVSHQHAINIGNLLLQRVQGQAEPQGQPGQQEGARRS